MFLLRSVDGDADGKVCQVLFDVILHGLLVVVDAIGREGEAIRVEPVMVTTEKFHLDVVADLINKLDFEKRFTTDEFPNHRFHSKFGVVLMVEHIVDEGFGNFPRHPLLNVFANKITVFTSQLTVLSDNEGNVLRHARLPSILVLFDIDKS